MNPQLGIDARIEECHYSLPAEDVAKIKQLISDCLDEVVPDRKLTDPIFVLPHWNECLDELKERRERLGL